MDFFYTSALMAAVLVVAAYHWGRRKGRLDEKRRMYNLIHEATQTRWSGSLNWVANAHHDDRTSLIPEAEWFSDSDKNKLKKVGQEVYR